MEQNQNPALFSLNIDPLTKAHLSESAKWARFLAIVGMVFLILLVIFGVFLSTALTSMAPQIEGMDEFGGAGAMPAGFGIGMAILYIIVALIWFFPLLYLLRFANKMKRSLAANDQQSLNTAFQNLKICFRFVGIVTIIVLVLYAIAILFMLLGAAAFS